MNFDTRFLVVALATYAIATGIASFGVPLIWRFRRPRSTSITYANDLLRLRLAPAATGLIASLCAIVAFNRFEPRSSGETMGVLLVLSACASPLAFLVGSARLTTAWWRTRCAMRSWMAHATPIALAGLDIPCFVVEAEFPIVAVVGIVRPRLMIARAVLDHCSPEELAAVLAHERAHIARHDNARYALFQAAPDPLLWSASLREMIASWHDATEEAADDATSREGDASRLNLAAALVRVARLVPAGAPRFDLPASALYRGEPLERRVRRLLDDRSALEARPRLRAWQLALPLALLLIGLSSLGAIQRLVEAAVRFLP